MYSHKEYMRKYYQEHKEEMKEYKKKWLEKNPDYPKEYWQKNKDKLYEGQRKYQKENKKRFTELCNASRKRRVERLKAEGCINAWSVVSAGAEPKYKKIGE